MCISSGASASGHWTDSCADLPPQGLAAPDPRGTVVLIIDDLGYHYDTGMDMVELPGKVNLAVLPHTPYATKLARAGHQAGKEIMLHAPMSNSGGMPIGPGGLTPSLSEEDFAQVLEADIEAIPHVRGINNHMGSELTTMPQQMGWVMGTLLRRNLYFVDSRTSPATIAGKTAARFAVPHLSRSVFLDNEATERAIDRQFRALVRRAEHKGLAVGIGHPYAETANYLHKALPALKCRGIRLALVSEVLRESGSLPDTAAPPLDDYSPASEPDFDTMLSHISLGLGDSVLSEVKDTRGEHGVGTAQGDTFYQVIQVTHSP
ncbi:hypothetical protein C0039_20675 [Pseudohalioglobus lutimaris]|uniref:Divergent polysaccharide deacetylase family protein n=1 Tax=Pseudohalioglobus lutimaris TaxID=1737061 RepID=A0A2N5WWK7_9GAMM|nr:hypothetical protein C0039_20675 [Pseudohalioglobus lutimaris]